MQYTSTLGSVREQRIDTEGQPVSAVIQLLSITACVSKYHTLLCSGFMDCGLLLGKAIALCKKRVYLLLCCWPPYVEVVYETYVRLTGGDT